MIIIYMKLLCVKFQRLTGGGSHDLSLGDDGDREGGALLLELNLDIHP